MRFSPFYTKITLIRDEPIGFAHCCSLFSLLSTLIVIRAGLELREKCLTSAHPQMANLPDFCVRLKL